MLSKLHYITAWNGIPAVFGATAIRLFDHIKTPGQNFSILDFSSQNVHKLIF